MHKKISMDAKKCRFALVTVLLAIFLILLGPADYFTHSNVSAIDFPEIGWISQEEYGEEILLEQGDSFSVEFVPGQRHFDGFYMYLGAQDAKQGQLDFTVSDENGKVIGKDKLLLDGLVLPEWEKVTIKSNISVGKEYTITISNKASSAPVKLFTLDDVYIPEETISGNIPLRYTYNVSTFTSQEKILISLAVIALWLLYAAEVVPGHKNFIKKSGVCLLLTVLLAWNGLYGSLDHNNTAFDSYQYDSEALVIGAIDACQAGLHLEQPGFSLGDYTSADDGVSAGTFEPYRSQYGLQGAVFAFLSKFTGIETLYLLCSFCFAVVAILIVCLINIQYDRLMAGIFYVVFLLSPWITNFARNLYWVEFTWFIPMAIGLFCAWKINDQKCRILCYAAAFFSLLIKSLCGYEYVSTIMMGLIQFLLVDLACAASRKDWKSAKNIFKTVFCLGLAALAGFAAAILLHAYCKGEGSIPYGVERIFTEDVLRRTTGGNGNRMLGRWDELSYSMDRSLWSTICGYFSMDTKIYFSMDMQIITGLDGNLFPLLCMIPAGLLYMDAQKKRLDLKQVYLYVICFFTTISWFVLAKGHSAIHYHMNYVLWYFGFVQICLYIIVKKLIDRFGCAAAPCASGALSETDHEKNA